MIGFYNYTVILTYIGTIFGLLGILSAFSGNLILAITFLMLTGVCDMFDGKIARTMKRNKDEKAVKNSQKTTKRKRREK